MTEATAVEARGRISPQDLGLWNEEQIEPLARVTRFLREHGAVAGIQLAHAGRKASTARPWDGGKPLAPPDGLEPDRRRPAQLAFDEGYQTPGGARRDGDRGADRNVRARGGARGPGRLRRHRDPRGPRLLDPRVSVAGREPPRTTQWGGTFDGRIRFLCRSSRRPRASGRTRAAAGASLDHRLAGRGRLDRRGFDRARASAARSGCRPHRLFVGRHRAARGDRRRARVPDRRAARIRAEAAIPTAAIGIITAAAQAEHILRTGQADLVFLARELLRDPYWPLRAARELGAPVPPPVQYERAWR